jgi:DNA-binding transcriptional LysR family regulator
MGIYPSHMTTWPELTALEVLVAVADHGGLSAAARALGMAQPNASRSVARLESRFGLPLLRRSTAGSTLTPEGLLLVGWAREVLAGTKALVDNATALSQHGSRTLSVTASQTIAEQLLPGWLSQFRARHRTVRVEVRVANTATVMADVRTGDCDLGFIEGPIPPRSANLTTIGHDELVLVVAPSHPWARRRNTITRAELLDTTLITREPGSGTRRVLDEALGAPVTPELELGSNAAVRVAVFSGAGPAVLSRLAVADALASGALTLLPIEGVELRRPLRAVWAGPRRLGGPAADLVVIARTAMSTAARQ